MPTEETRRKAVPLLAILTAEEQPNAEKISDLIQDLADTPQAGIELALVIQTNLADMIREAVPSNGAPYQLAGSEFLPEKDETSELDPVAKFAMHMVEHQCNDEWEDIIDHLLQISHSPGMFSGYFAKLCLMYRVIAASLRGAGGGRVAGVRVNPEFGIELPEVDS